MGSQMSENATPIKHSNNCCTGGHACFALEMDVCIQQFLPKGAFISRRSVYLTVSCHNQIITSFFDVKQM